MDLPPEGFQVPSRCFAFVRKRNINEPIHCRPGALRLLTGRLCVHARIELDWLLRITRLTRLPFQNELFDATQQTILINAYFARVAPLFRMAGLD